MLKDAAEPSMCRWELVASKVLPQHADWLTIAGPREKSFRHNLFAIQVLVLRCDAVAVVVCTIKIQLTHHD